MSGWVSLRLWRVGGFGGVGGFGVGGFGGVGGVGGAAWAALCRRLFATRALTADCGIVAIVARE